MKKILTALLLAIMALPAFPATYFASPSGGGDGSSYTLPATFAQGVAALKNGGDTLYLLGGTYEFADKFSINKQGAASKYIVISGYPGEKAVLDFHKVAYGVRGVSIHASSLYVHIKDLAIAWSGKNNLYNEGSYCIFENLDIYGSADTGCQMKKGGNNIIKNVDSHDNFDYETMSGTTANFGGNADGFADKQFTGDGNHYIGCRAWNNSDDGWDFFQRISNSNTVIENCICYQNGPASYDMSKNPRALTTDKAWFDAKVGTQMTDRYGKTITISLEKYPCQGNGNGFKMGGAQSNGTTSVGTDHKILIHHSMAVANNARGFDQNNNGGTMWVYNNSAYDNGVNFGFTTAFGTNHIRNNVSFQGRGADQPESKTVAANDHNTWNSGFSCTAADFRSLDTTQLLAPRAADGSLPEGTFMRLADGSKLIDAGVDVGQAYMGDAPDLGCYETDGIVRPYVVCTSGNAEQWILQGDPIAPIVFQWGGAATKLSCSAKPDGITHKISNNNQTLTLSGSPKEAGTYTITVTTVSDMENVSLSAVIHVKSAQARRVAFVTLPGASEDQALLTYLRQNDSLLVIETDATDNTVDYSSYEVIVLGSKPNSGAPGFVPLKGYNKPMVLLKPFLLKSTVWGWGTAVNTSDLSVYVSVPEHPLFKGLTVTEGELQLFSDCNTNAVTAISAWTATEGVERLASPVSNNEAFSIAILPAGTDCNGTILPQRMIMIGVSEYSTAYLTPDGKKLIENAILLQMGMDIPTGISTINHKSSIINHKYIKNGQLFIQAGDAVYNAAGRRVNP